MKTPTSVEPSAQPFSPPGGYSATGWRSLALAASLGMASITTSLTALSQAWAGKFQSTYVTFNLPDKWGCTLERTEWVCRMHDGGLADAMIILTAKEVGPTDSLANYEQVLKTPRTIVTKTGQAVQSTVYETKVRTIDGHPWIDSLHFSSEVYNYYTRYVVTKKDRVGVIVTFSAHKLQYTKYSQDFFNAIASLKVIATPESTGRNMAGQGETMGPTGVGDGLQAGMDESHNAIDDVMGGGMSSGKSLLRISAVLLLILGAAWYLWSTQRQKQRAKKKARPKSNSDAA